MPAGREAEDYPPDDIRWMRRALELAAMGEALGEVPVGAVLVAEGRELGAGYNAPIGLQDPTSHAEIIAIRAACRAAENYRLSGTTLYVTLEPCSMCAGALVHARVSRLVFGTREPKAGAVVSRSRLLEGDMLNWQVDVTEGILAEDCQRQLSGFFASRRALKKARKYANEARAQDKSGLQRGGSE